MRQGGGDAATEDTEALHGKLQEAVTAKDYKRVVELGTQLRRLAGSKKNIVRAAPKEQVGVGRPEAQESPATKLERVPDFISAIKKAIANFSDEKRGSERELETLLNLFPEPGTPLAWPLLTQLGEDSGRDRQLEYYYFGELEEKKVRGQTVREWKRDTSSKAETGKEAAMEKFVPADHPSRHQNTRWSLQLQGKKAREAGQTAENNPYEQAEGLIYKGLGVRFGAPSELIEKTSKWRDGYDHPEKDFHY